MSDVAASFRVFVFLDRKQSREGLSPAELARWEALKRELSRKLSGDAGEERACQRASLRVPARLRVSFASLGVRKQEEYEKIMSGLNKEVEKRYNRYIDYG